jgi:hypothetical protein
MRRFPAVVAAALLFAGCAANPPQAMQSNQPGARLESCKSGEIAQLQAQLAAEVAERQRITRAAARREEALKKQLEAMKSIERGILEREDRVRYETR